MHIRAPKDFWSGVMFIAFAATALLAARGYSLGAAGKMGPGYFPTLVSWILLGFGVVGFLGGILGGYFAPKAPPIVFMFAWAAAFVPSGSLNPRRGSDFVGSPVIVSFPITVV